MRISRDPVCSAIGSRTGNQAAPSRTGYAIRRRRIASRAPESSQQRLHSQRGLSLIDALVAIGLLSTFMVAAQGLLIPALGTDRYAVSLTAATQLAQAKLEQLRAAPYDSLNGGADPQPLAADGTVAGSQARYSRSWTTAAGPIANTTQVTVSVQWNDLITRQVSLKTIVRSD